MITAWLALDDVDEENGCLRYIDGSHPDPQDEVGLLIQLHFRAFPAEDASSTRLIDFCMVSPVDFMGEIQLFSIHGLSLGLAHQ